MVFCQMVEDNLEMKKVRDLSFMDELIKVRKLTSIMNNNLSAAPSADSVDIFEYSQAAEILSGKLDVLYSLNTTMEGDDEDSFTFNVQGTTKAVKINVKKLRESITFLDEQVKERQACADEFYTAYNEIDMDQVKSDDDFLN